MQQQLRGTNNHLMICAQDKFWSGQIMKQVFCVKIYDNTIFKVLTVHIQYDKKNMTFYNSFALIFGLNE